MQLKLIKLNRINLADITTLHTKGIKGNIENYRLVGILPNLSKILERILFERISVYFDRLLSNQECGFWKGYSTQYFILNLLEKWKTSFDKDKAFGALLTDISKAFDCINYELLTAKLNAYGFTVTALQIIDDYLWKREQRTKIVDHHSSWSEILLGVLPRSNLGPLLFDIFLSDLFLVLKDIDVGSQMITYLTYVKKLVEIYLL